MECKSSVLAPVEAFGGGIDFGESLRNGFVANLVTLLAILVVLNAQFLWKK